VHAPTEKKSDDSKDGFYEVVEQVFSHFPEYHMQILLGDCSGKLGRDDIFKPTTKNESLRQDGGDNGVRKVNFVALKNLFVKIMLFLY
jgi:hypothetical protein